MKKCVADSVRLESCKTKQPYNIDAILVSLLFLRCPSLVNLFGFRPSAPENSRLFQGDVEPQLTLADHAFKMIFALHSELSKSQVGQLRTIVIKFWISSRVFFQQSNKLVN